MLRMIRDEYMQWPMDLRDGVKVMMPDGWFLVRGSNTEPIISLVVEVKSEEKANQIIEEVRGRINEMGLN